MAQFKIGDRVKCINGKDYEPLAAIWTLKEGAEYVVQDIMYCCKYVFLNVGAVSQDDVQSWKCADCQKKYVLVGQPCLWFDSSRFVKIQEQPRIVRIQMDMPEPSLN